MRTWQHLPLMLSSCAVGSNPALHFLLYLSLVVFLCFVSWQAFYFGCIPQTFLITCKMQGCYALYIPWINNSVYIFELGGDCFKTERNKRSVRRPLFKSFCECNEKSSSWPIFVTKMRKCFNVLFIVHLNIKNWILNRGELDCLSSLKL